MKNSSKIALICILIAAIVVTGYINYKINNDSIGDTADAMDAAAEGEMTEDVDTKDVAAVFAQFRTDKEATRTKEIEYLDSVINSGEADEATVNEAMSQKVAITSYMEQETNIEGLLKSSGYNDAVVTISSDSVNVVVSEEALSEDQAVQILEIVKTTTGQPAQNIKIIPQG
jgi:stage III sporulation protein AH